MQYTEIFKIVKIENFPQNFVIFLVFAQNIDDCGYTLEPPHRGGSNEYPQSIDRGGSHEYPQSMF